MLRLNIYILLIQADFLDMSIRAIIRLLCNLAASFNTTAIAHFKSNFTTAVNSTQLLTFHPNAVVSSLSECGTWSPLVTHLTHLFLIPYLMCCCCHIADSLNLSDRSKIFKMIFSFQEVRCFSRLRDPILSSGRVSIRWLCQDMSSPMPHGYQRCVAYHRE